MAEGRPDPLLHVTSASREKVRTQARMLARLLAHEAGGDWLRSRGLTVADIERAILEECRPRTRFGAPAPMQEE
jgi:glutathione S-transferase